MKATCFYICIGCVVIATATMIGLIWLPNQSDFAWKSLCTTFAVFGGSAVIGTVDSLFNGKSKDEPK